MGPDNQQAHSLKQNRLVYITIGIILLLFAGLLTVVTNMALAVADSQQGQIQVSGLVAGPPPTQAAVINSPIGEQRFTNKTITVSGTCPSGTFVQIYKNSLFAGTVACSFGAFSLPIDLVPDRNDLVAKVIDNINQYGPDSSLVTVYLDQNLVEQGKPGDTANAAASPNLLLDVTKLYQGGLPNQKIKLDIKILGGVSPYAMYIDWGDGKTDLVLQSKAGEVTQFHSYDSPGNYRISIEATDAANNKASIQTVAIINGEYRVNAPLILKDPEKALPLLATVWQVYIVVVLAILSFSLGEKRMLRLHRKKLRQ
jgi:hypothetical protein